MLGIIVVVDLEVVVVNFAVVVVNFAVVVAAKIQESSKIPEAKRT